MKTEITTLKNKLRIATHYDETSELIALNIRVNTGSRYETEEENGISHFLEHMVFKGTLTRTCEQIAKEFDDIGGGFNAQTSKESTVYYITVLKDFLEKAMEIMSDILQNSVFDIKEITTEKDVILQEISMERDTPSRIIWRHLYSTVYPNQSYGRLASGTPESISKFTRDTFLNYMKKFYTTGNIIISISGNSIHNDNVKLIENYFKNLNTNTNNEDMEKSCYNGNYFVEKKKDLNQVQLMLTLKGCSYTDKNYYKINILGDILGGGSSSRLFQNIREKLGLCYSIWSSPNFSLDGGLFMMYSAVTPNKVNVLIDAIINEFKQITSNISQEELTRALIQYKTNLVLQLESSTRKAFKIGSDLSKFGKVRDIKGVLKELDSITIEDLQNLMIEILKSKPAIAMLGNLNEDTYDYDTILSKFNN